MRKVQLACLGRKMHTNFHGTYWTFCFSYLGLLLGALGGEGC